MAFNPFHTFRKNAKVWFAILTIVCMITFILSFGKGDAFQWLLDKFGGGRGAQGDVITTMYGKKVYEGEVQHLRYHRHVANEFVQKVIAEGTRQALGKALEHMEKG